MIYAYPCELTPDEGGSLLATFPDVPEAITGGGDRPEALGMAEDALATALAGYVHEKWDIPTPSEAAHGQQFVAVPTIVAAKLALYSAMRAQCITKVELARRLDISESAVESWPTRTFTPTLASSKRPSELWDEAWSSKSLVPGSVSALRNLDPHPQREEAYLMAELGAEARKRQAGFRTDPLAASRCPRCGRWPGATSGRFRGP